METWGAKYWPVFLILSALWILFAFGIPETIALFTAISTHTDNTLSNYAHVELHVTAKMTIHTIAWFLSLITWALFVVLITGHIWFDLGG